MGRAAGTCRQPGSGAGLSSHAATPHRPGGICAAPGPSDVLWPALAARIRVEDRHWFLLPARDGRRRGDLGARNSKGYAQVSAGKKGKSQLLSRLVLSRADRAPAPGEQACHNDAVCPYRHCVAPGCLYWGTAQQNQADATRKRMANRAARAA